MEYIVGVALALFVCGAASPLGMDRDRVFYPTMLIVVATYYVLFALIDGGHKVLLSEIVIAAVFTVVAVVGFKRNLWLVAVALAGHGVLDFFHHARPRAEHRCATCVAGVLSGVRFDSRCVLWLRAGLPRQRQCATVQRTGSFVMANSLLRTSGLGSVASLQEQRLTGYTVHEFGRPRRGTPGAGSLAAAPRPRFTTSQESRHHVQGAPRLRGVGLSCYASSRHSSRP